MRSLDFLSILRSVRLSPRTCGSVKFRRAHRVFRSLLGACQILSQSITNISRGGLLAGLLPFVSPCVLPLVPSYISYITGLSIEQLTDSTVRSKFKKAIVVNALLFIAGFSAVFVSFGASASFIGQAFITYQDYIRRIGGILIVIFGLYLLGILNINFLKMEHRFQFRNRPVGYVGSFLIGVAFAAGWTPCVGPVLGTICCMPAPPSRC